MRLFVMIYGRTKRPLGLKYQVANNTALTP